MLISLTVASTQGFGGYPLAREQFLGQRGLCARRFRRIMKERQDEELEEAKELFKEGLKRILQATKKVSEKVVEGFREGYAQDVTQKEEEKLEKGGDEKQIIRTQQKE